MSPWAVIDDRGRVVSRHRTRQAAERAWWAGHDAGYRAGLEARDHTAAMAVMAAREEKPA